MVLQQQYERDEQYVPELWLSVDGEEQDGFGEAALRGRGGSECAEDHDHVLPGGDSDGGDVFHQERDVWGVPGREGRAGGEPNGGADTQLQRKRGAAVGDRERGEWAV